MAMNQAVVGSMAKAPGSLQPRETGQVEQRLGRLGSGLEKVCMTVGELDERLRLVMTQGAPVGIPDRPVDPELSPMARELDALIDKVDLVAIHLSSILNRVQL